MSETNLYYDCKTCGKPFGFGRVRFEPAECNRCDPPPPYVPEPSDFELGEQEERERIIKLLEDYAFNNGPSGGILLAVSLIKGKNK